MPRESGASSNRRRQRSNREAAAYCIVRRSLSSGGHSADPLADDDSGADDDGARAASRHCEERSDEAIHSASITMDCFASLAMTKRKKRPGSLPAFLFSSRHARPCAGHPRLAERQRKSWMAGSSPAMTVLASVRSAFGRRCRPRLDQRVVVDGFALRLLVRQLALGRDGAVLLGLLEPVLGRLLLVEFWPASALHAGLLKTLQHRVLSCCQSIHRRLRRLRTGRRVADVLPPQLRKFRIIRHVIAGRGPLHARRRTVELDQPAELWRALGERLVPDVGLTNEGETDVALLQGHRLGDDELQIEPGCLAAIGWRGLQERQGSCVLIAKLHAVLPVRAVR